jgi:hypothetical protein
MGCVFLAAFSTAIVTQQAMRESRTDKLIEVLNLRTSNIRDRDSTEATHDPRPAKARGWATKSVRKHVEVAGSVKRVVKA